MQLRIATRQSALALWQARFVAERLRELDAVTDVELVPMTTRGDEILDRSLQQIGGKGLFIKELEVAMQEGRAELAVHSMKDVPAEMPDGFCIAAVLERASPFDALVRTDGGGLDSVPEGGVIGSSSLRRQAQLRAQRPDVDVRPLRGNVNTRLDKLDRGDYDAIVLACAGLHRLGMAERISQVFDPADMLPAAAQGVVGIECRDSDGPLRDVLAQLEDADTRTTTAAERAVAHRLEASCQSPVASYATLTDSTVLLTAMVASVDGSTVLREQTSGDRGQAEHLGRELADRLLAKGAGALLTQ